MRTREIPSERERALLIYLIWGRRLQRNLYNTYPKYLKPITYITYIPIGYVPIIEQNASSNDRFIKNKSKHCGSYSVKWYTDNNIISIRIILHIIIYFSQTVNSCGRSYIVLFDRENCVFIKIYRGFDRFSLIYSYFVYYIFTPPRPASTNVGNWTRFLNKNYNYYRIIIGPRDCEIEYCTV